MMGMHGLNNWAMPQEGGSRSLFETQMRVVPYYHIGIVPIVVIPITFTVERSKNCHERN